MHDSHKAERLPSYTQNTGEKARSARRRMSKLPAVWQLERGAGAGAGAGAGGPERGIHHVTTEDG